MYIVDFLLIGLFVTTGVWYLSNHYLSNNINSSGSSNSSISSSHSINSSSSNASLEQMLERLEGNTMNMEWLYCFDVHCNSFFPLFLIIYVLNYFLLPIHVLLSHGWIGVLLGNTSVALGLTAYLYVTLRGLIDVPFVVPSKIVNYLFLYPVIAIWFILWIGSCFVFRVNLLHLFVNLYFV